MIIIIMEIRFTCYEKDLHKFCISVGKHTIFWFIKLSLYIFLLRIVRTQLLAFSSKLKILILISGKVVKVYWVNFFF